MRKFVILLMIFCVLAGSASVYAENYYEKGTISCEEAVTIRVPQPEGEIDPGRVYFTQEFTFVPEQDGTYRFMIRYEEDEANPYEIFMDVAGEYREIPNGCEFEGKSGET